MLCFQLNHHHHNIVISLYLVSFIHSFIRFPIFLSLSVHHCWWFPRKANKLANGLSRGRVGNQSLFTSEFMHSSCYHFNECYRRMRNLLFFFFFCSSENAWGKHKKTERKRDRKKKKRFCSHRPGLLKWFMFQFCLLLLFENLFFSINLYYISSQFFMLKKNQINIMNSDKLIRKVKRISRIFSLKIIFEAKFDKQRESKSASESMMNVDLK